MLKKKGLSRTETEKKKEAKWIIRSRDSSYLWEENTKWEGHKEGLLECWSCFISWSGWCCPSGFTYENSLRCAWFVYFSPWQTLIQSLLEKEERVWTLMSNSGFHITALLLTSQDPWESCLTFLCLRLHICERKIIQLPSSHTVRRINLTMHTKLIEQY